MISRRSFLKGALIGAGTFLVPFKRAIPRLATDKTQYIDLARDLFASNIGKIRYVESTFVSYDYIPEKCSYLINFSYTLRLKSNKRETWNVPFYTEGITSKKQVKTLVCDAVKFAKRQLRRDIRKYATTQENHLAEAVARAMGRREDQIILDAIAGR